MDKRVPEVRFKGFTDDWEQHSLDSLTDSLEYGLNVSAKKYDGKNKYIRITDIDDISHQLLYNHLTSPNIDLKSAKNYLLRTGDILFARTGASVGKTYLYKESDGIAYYAGFLIRARIKKVYNSETIFQNTLTRKYSNFVKITSQRSGQPGINVKEYSAFSIYLSNNNKENNDIGELFQKLDKLILLQERNILLYRSIKNGLLQKMFPKDKEKVPEVRFNVFHDEWEQRKLGEIGNTFTGLTGKNKDDFGHGNAKYITYMNVFSNPISDLKMVDNIEIDEKQNQVQKGDVLFTTSSETPEEVGMSSVWTKDVKNYYLNSFCFGYRPLIKINAYYLASVLRSTPIRKKIILLAQGISRYNISKNKVMNISIFIPDSVEQEKMGMLLKNVNDSINLYQQQLESYKTIKKYYLQKLFI